MLRFVVLLAAAVLALFAPARGLAQDTSGEDTGGRDTSGRDTSGEDTRDRDQRSSSDARDRDQRSSDVRDRDQRSSDVRDRDQRSSDVRDRDQRASDERAHDERSLHERSQDAITVEERPVAEAITVEGRDTCLDARRLAMQVGAWLERDRIATTLGVVVRIDADGTSFVITLDGDEVATRRFDSLPAECPDRRAAVALAIALALDAAILESIGIPPPAPAPAPEPEPEPPAQPESPPPPPPPPPGERSALSIELEAWLALELLPDPALGGLLAASWIAGEGVRLRAGVLATALVGTSVVPGAADVALVTGRADVCVDRTVLARVLLGGCAGVAAGALLTSGHDLPVVYAPALPWAGALVRAELRWLPIDPLALTFGAEGVFSFVQPRLDVGDGTGGILASRTLSTAGLAIAVGAAWVIE